MIGEVISKLLTSHEGLTGIVPEERVYPYVMDQGTPLPAVIYAINSAVPQYTKDGWVKDTVSFSVLSFSRDYDELQSVVRQVRDALELNSGEEGVTIDRIYITGMDEAFNLMEEVYMNRLTFSTNLVET